MERENLMVAEVSLRAPSDGCRGLCVRAPQCWDEWGSGLRQGTRGFSFREITIVGLGADVLAERQDHTQPKSKANYILAVRGWVTGW